MQHNAGEGGSNNGDRANLFAVDRRSYLKLAGTAAGTAGLLSGTAAGAERHGIRFNRTVDMVAEGGCDPTGGEPCDAKIQEAADNYTLLKFPAGEYKITEKNVILGLTNVGFVGEGDVRFKVPPGFNQKLLVVDRGRGVLFENIDIDLRAADATPGLHLGGEDDIEIHDVEFIGQGIHPKSDPRGKGDGHPDVTNAFTPIVRSESGLGRVSNVVAKNEGLMGAYNHGTGRVGVWIGMTTKGTIRLTNCQFEGFPNNGLYTSRTPGTVQVEGGVFRNNDITQVRLSSKGSYVKNAIISADFDNSDSPNPRDTLNSRGVRFEAGSFGYGGAEVHNCDISIVSTPNSSGGVVVGSDGADHGVYDSRISIDANDSQYAIRGFYAKAPTGYGNNGPPPEPHTATVHNTSITGSANGAEAIEIDQREESVVTGCCINQTGTDRDGVTFEQSDRSTVKNSTIDVTGQQVLTPGCTATTRNISNSGSCPVATRGAGAYLPHSLSIESNGGSFSYEFTVSGDLGKSTARGATIDPNDTISGSTARGTGGGGGLDSYGYSGSIIDLNVDGDADVYIDGETVDTELEHTLAIEATGPYSSYTFSVSGRISPRQGIGGTDSIAGSMATGALSGSGQDIYGFSGSLTDIEMNGTADVYLDGEPVETGHEHTLTIEADGSYSSYAFSVSGAIAPQYGIGGQDSISGSRATGALSGTGTDSYGFSGSLTDIDMDGTADVYLDGEPVETDHEHTLLVEATGSYSSYGFSVSGSISPRQGIGGIDDISGSRATGAVGGRGRDVYGFSGELHSLDVDGDANVSLDGEPVETDRGVLTITSDGGQFSYRLSTSDGLEKSTAMGATIDDNDDLSGTTATGTGGGGGLDSYRFFGEITELYLDGDTQLYRNGTKVGVEEFLPHVLTVEATGPYARYGFSASGGIAAREGIGGVDSIDVDAGRATGAISGDGRDSYAFAGELRDLDVDGNVDVYVDGQLM